MVSMLAVAGLARVGVPGSARLRVKAMALAVAVAIVGAVTRSCVVGEKIWVNSPTLGGSASFASTATTGEATAIIKMASAPGIKRILMPFLSLKCEARFSTECRASGYCDFLVSTPNYTPLIIFCQINFQIFIHSITKNLYF